MKLLALASAALADKHGAIYIEGYDNNIYILNKFRDIRYIQLKHASNNNKKKKKNQQLWSEV